ncbi:MAG: hypothetical protein GQ525_13570, partial [Draconibacterium sp.]|nr:hypothetical protein [Draconibacterium sp.]
MNYKRLFFYLIISFILIPFSSYADLNYDSNNPKEISSFEIFTDSIGLQFVDIQKINNKEFKIYKGENINLNQVYWFKIKINNQELDANNNFIHFHDFFSETKLYQILADSSIFESIGGALIQAKKRTTQGFFNDKILFTSSQGNETTLFIKVIREWDINSNLSISIIPEETINNIIFKNYLAQTLFSGAVLIICLFNLILFLFTWERLYFYYISYIVIMTIFFLSYTQILEYILLSNFPKIDLYLFFSLPYAIPLYVLFLSEVLRNENVQFWRSALKKISLYIFIIAVLINTIAFFKYQLAVALNDIFLMLNIFLLIVLFFKLIKKVSNTFKVILIGTLFIVIGGVATIISDYKEYNPMHIYYYQIGFCMELIFFTIAINYMHNNNRLAKIKVQLKNSLLEAQHLKEEKETNFLKEEVDKKNRNLTCKAIAISQKEELIKKVISELSLLKSDKIKNFGIDKIISNM